VSIQRAIRADTPKAPSTKSVAIPVDTGWCQNNHSILPAETTTVDKNATMLVRFCADFLMPTPKHAISKF
jgi:hypothetical protein